MVQVLDTEYMRCGWGGCDNESTAIWEITDSFGRTYCKDACDSCAQFWIENRPRCVKVKDLKKDKECLQKE
jgi:hypothetical protein